MVSRSSRPRTKGKRMPMPRSKPSMTTYIIRPKPMMTAQMRGRSMPMASAPPRRGWRRIHLVGCGGHRSRRAAGAGRLRLLLRLVMDLRALGDQLQHVADPGPEHDQVHHDEEDE